MFLQTAPDYQLIQQFAQVAKLPFFEISITSGQLLGVFDTTGRSHVLMMQCAILTADWMKN